MWVFARAPARRSEKRAFAWRRRRTARLRPRLRRIRRRERRLPEARDLRRPRARLAPRPRRRRGRRHPMQRCQQSRARSLRRAGARILTQRLAAWASAWTVCGCRSGLRCPRIAAAVSKAPDASNFPVPVLNVGFRTRNQNPPNGPHGGPFPFFGRHNRNSRRIWVAGVPCFMTVFVARNLHFPAPAL